MKTLTRSVHVNPDPEQDPDRTAAWFHEGDELPRWAEKYVTNEKAFAEPDEDESPFAPKLDYVDMSAKDLRELCTDRGLDTSGTKAELADRLQLNDAAVS